MEIHLHIAVLVVYLGVLDKSLRLQLLVRMVVAGRHSEVQPVMPMDRMVAVAARMGRSEVSRCIISFLQRDPF